jgi:hypothetical protein
MRIVIFASLTLDTTANYLINNLRNESNKLHIFSDVEGPLVDYLINGTPDISVLCEEYAIFPDLFLFIEGGSMKIFPKGLERLSCLTCWYGIDTHMNYEKHLAISRVFDVSFIAQKEFVERLKLEGIIQVFWLPLGFEPSINQQNSEAKDFLISYVGSDNANMHQERHNLITAIRNNFDNISFGRATPTQMSDIYSRSLMVFNKSVNNDINMRYFEAMGEGAVLLTDKAINNGAEDLFQEGTHFVEYRDRNHLITLIEYFRDHPLKAKEIGDNAQKLINERHTYKHRTDSMLTTLKSAKKTARPQPINYFDVFLRLDIIDASLLSLVDIFSSAKTGRVNMPIKLLATFSIKIVLFCSKIVRFLHSLIVKR